MGTKKQRRNKRKKKEEIQIKKNRRHP